MKAYYDARADEYDDVWLRRGFFAAREPEKWIQERDELIERIAKLAPARTLDVACGTGFLTRHLPGGVVGLDQSERMLARAREQAPSATFVQGDALSLPFDDGAFDRVFTSFFYGHLEEPERQTFLREARRVARELVVVDAALQPDRGREEWQERTLADGSRWRVYKRYFDGAELAAELGGGRVVHEGRRFVLVTA